MNKTHYRILITSARSLIALDLARHLKHSGYTVYATDTNRMHFTFFSNTIEKYFINPSPRFQPNGFIKKLLEIVETYQIDFVIPIFEEVFYLSQAKHLFPKTCTIFCDDFEKLHLLHNKWFFYCKLKQYGLTAPKTIFIKTEQELFKFRKELDEIILKPCYSRGAIDIRPLKPDDSIPNILLFSQNPWIAQEYLSGKKFCSYGICKEGRLQANAVYPYLFNEDHFCLHFEAIDHPKINHWVEDFVKRESFTGHIAFDFIESGNRLYPIECNPRATFGFNLFTKETLIERAFFSNLASPIQPKLGNKTQLSIGMLIYGWKKFKFKTNWKIFLKKIFSTKDMIFNFKDLKPFIFQPIVFLSYFYRSLKLKKDIMDLYLFDIQWNGESFYEKKGC